MPLLERIAHLYLDLRGVEINQMVFFCMICICLVTIPSVFIRLAPGVTLENTSFTDDGGVIAIHKGGNGSSVDTKGPGMKGIRKIILSIVNTKHILCIEWRMGITIV